VAVHDPLQAPQRCFDLYRQPLSPYLNYAPEHPFDNGEYHIRDESLLPWPRTRAMVLKRKRELYACITHMDEQIGRVLDTLDRCGYADNTIIVFTADHGCAHGQHGLCGKQSLHDHSIRVPLVFTGPGIQASAINQGLCYLTDLFPTLCELLDISPPGSVQGRSFAACLQDSQAPGRPWLYLAYTSVQRAIRRGDWKLIEYVVREKRFQQLFNLEMDPWEIDNCIDDPMQATLREELCALLEEGRTQFNDHRPEHGERYWRSRASATWGTCEPGSFRDQKPIHQHLWAQAAEEC
jgi:arylsulfatase A-like enzyme